MEEIKKTGVFEGETTNLVFTHNLALQSGETYFTVGQLVGWSLLNNGPGLHGLHPVVYSMMTSQTIGIPLEDVEIPQCMEPAKKNIQLVCSNRIFESHKTKISSFDV